jgi:hypothetical protein
MLSTLSKLHTHHQNSSGILYIISNVFKLDHINNLLMCHFIGFQPFYIFFLLHLDRVQIPSLNLNHSTFLYVLKGFSETYFQPHLALQHSPVFQQERHFLVFILLLSNKGEKMSKLTNFRSLGNLVCTALVLQENTKDKSHWSGNR